MATYTEHHHLHQWEPGDSFLRTDFNEDFARIDGALGGLAQAHADLNYHLYNLLLQNDYEGKYTGFKRALIFDGFLNDSGIAALTPGVCLDPAAHVLFVDSQGQSSIDRGYGHARSAEIAKGGYREAKIVPTGNGTLTCIEIYCGGKARFEVYDDGTGELLASCENTIEASITAAGAFSLTVELTAGKTYRIRMVNLKDGKMTLGCSAACSDGFGILLDIRPRTAVEGVMTTPVWDVDTDGSALAWVRHSAGTVVLSAGDGGGDWISFQQTGTREGLTLDRVPCAESTFRLDRLPAGGRLALRFALAGTDLRLYDYGVVLL